MVFLVLFGGGFWVCCFGFCFGFCWFVCLGVFFGWLLLFLSKYQAVVQTANSP